MESTEVTTLHCRQLEIGCFFLLYKIVSPTCFQGSRKISAYITHMHLAVRKIMETMHTVQKRVLSLNTSEKNKEREGFLENPYQEYRERKARIICEENLVISLNSFINAVVKILLTVRQSFLFFYFVGTHFRIFVYANLSSTFVRCAHLLRS